MKQEIQLAAIPLFEFGVFYAPDMELCALNTDFTVPGRVHCNGTIYSMPNQVTVTFAGDVTAAQKILPTKSPKDGSTWSRTLGTNIYQGEHDWNASSLNIPLGINNNPTNLHALIEIPPGSEPTNSLMGLQRYYNKADLIILVSNTNVTATSGAYNNFSTPVPWSNISSFVNTNASFRNEREAKTIQATQIDVAKFAANPTYNKLSSLLGHPVLILYVADLRTQTSGTESGVRLTNGIALPAAGLTVATYNPLYVLGHYNAPDTTPGSTNTGAPASLVADAITILSGAWQDGNTGTYDTRDASNTTINAAVLAGIVPSNSSYFSGGVENFFRLLETWSSDTLTFNGSIVALFPSQTANGYFHSTRSSKTTPSCRPALPWSARSFVPSGISRRPTRHNERALSLHTRADGPGRPCLFRRANSGSRGRLPSVHGDGERRGTKRGDQLRSGYRRATLRFCPASKMERPAGCGK